MYIVHLVGQVVFHHPWGEGGLLRLLNAWLECYTVPEELLKVDKVGTLLDFATIFPWDWWQEWG